jgi:hypothetical protein
MSYIRCLSNPEGLYIWAQSNGEVHISHNVRPPLASAWERLPLPRFTRGKIVATKRMYDAPPTIVVPWRHFKATCLQWDRHEGYPRHNHTNRGGLVVEEQHIYTSTGKLVPKNSSLAKTFKKVSDKTRTEILIRLGYRNQFLFMWRVTWMYVVRNVAEDTFS